jgi:deferrochelatase/peroxidase EfeB
MSRILLSRRGALAGGTGLLAGLGRQAAQAAEPADAMPFWGAHQAGIITPQQKHCCFMAFDLHTDSKADLVALLRAWTLAASRMAAGLPAGEAEDAFSPVPRAGQRGTASDEAYDDLPPDQPGLASRVESDTGEAAGLSPAHLTITFGFGAALFDAGGQDRFGLAKHRPEALVDLPVFPGDQLVPAISGGDLSVQACADDPQRAFHAVRQLARIAGEVAAIRWMQQGFLPDTPKGQTPRNLMGFRDGTINPSPSDLATLAQHVWVGQEGPDWMQGGSYQVNRRIRIALERWDRMKTGFQEQTIGRAKASGAPLGAAHEADPLPLEKTDRNSTPLIAEGAHVRIAAPEANHGAQMLRRGYSYQDGVNLVAERWPPWHQGLEYDAGLLFIAYQRDVRMSFIPMYEKMARHDMLNQFITHVSSALFACPAGMRPGEYIGQRLMEAV